jgi:hypothetical protein
MRVAQRHWCASRSVVSTTAMSRMSFSGCFDQADGARPRGSAPPFV